jgi:hypothetical protein
MIALQLEGRLGNQLFQYAFIYAESKRLNTTFYLDKSVEAFYLPSYFEIKNDFPSVLDNKIFSIKGYKNIFSFYLKRAFYDILRRTIFGKKDLIISNTIPVAEAFTQFKDHCMYKGHFQSESYFKDFEAEIRALYKIKKEHTEAFQQVFNQFNASKKKAVVHVRRSDYVDLDIALPVSYYKNAIGMINDSGVEYIFISDDPAFIEKEFAYLPGKFISTHSEIIDFQFLMNADICILSNSTFSWWGAWLNNNSNKQVFAPKYWFGFKEQKDYPVAIFEGTELDWVQV